MDGPRVLSEVSQKKRQILCDITYVWNLKYDSNELICKTETDSQTENRLVVAKVERVRDRLEV